MKRNTGTRALTLLLAVMLMTASCGTAAEKPSGGDTTSGEGTSTAEETTAARDTLPDDLDFGGETVNLFVDREMLIPEYNAEQDGDIVNDAIYERNNAVQERLNVTFNFIESDGLNANQKIFQGAVRSSVLAGESAYDIVAGYGLSMSILAGEKLFYNLPDTKYIDFDMPWWPDSLTGALSVFGKLYMASGDISTNTIGTSFGVLFNKDLTEKYQISGLYSLVDEGKWTFDKLFSLTSDIYTDLNSDSKKDKEDFFGIGMSDTFIDNAWYACGLRVVEQDDEMGQKVSPLLTSEKASDFINKMTKAFHGSNSGFISNDEENPVDFLNQKYVFMLNSIDYAASTLRDAPFEYGVLPTPKWDEAQENYITAATYTGSMYAIPTDAKDTDVSSAVIEALASEGYYRVAPAFFETAMKVKYSSDDDTSRMYDIIKASIMYDFGRVYSVAGLDGIPGMMRVAVRDNNKNWASTAAKKMSKLEKLLADLVEKFAE